MTESEAKLPLDVFVSSSEQPETVTYTPCGEAPREVIARVDRREAESRGRIRIELARREPEGVRTWSCDDTVTVPLREGEAPTTCAVRRELHGEPGRLTLEVGA